MPPTDNHWPWICLAAAFAVWVLLLLVNPARRSFRDGLRCMGRHGSIWAILAFLGVCYTVFKLGFDVYAHYALPEGVGPVFLWSRPWFMPVEDWPGVMKGSILPALEGLVGVFNVLVTTFPFSAIAAVLFFFNWENHHSVLLQALRRRTGGLVVYCFVLVCAGAALSKPFLFTELFKNAVNNMPQPLMLLQWASIVDWLSFLFEIMFGIGVQIYLILMVYAWVRGLHFTTRHLMDFAIRRFSYVMKWTAVGLALATVFINLPQILVNFPAAAQYFQAQNVLGLDFVDHVGRPVMAGFFILFSGMQIILTFHSESLVKAFKDYLHFLRKEAWSVAGWLFIAFFNFYILAVLNGAMKEGFSDDNGPAIAWSLVCPLLNAFVGGWMLASWVCLYKRSETGRMRDEHWVKY